MPGEEQRQQDAGFFIVCRLCLKRWIEEGEPPSQVAVSAAPGTLTIRCMEHEDIVQMPLTEPQYNHLLMFGIPERNELPC